MKRFMDNFVFLPLGFLALFGLPVLAFGFGVVWLFLSLGGVALLPWLVAVWWARRKRRIEWRQLWGIPHMKPDELFIASKALATVRELVERYGHDREAMIKAIAHVVAGGLRLGVNCYIRRCMKPSRN